jgi:glutamine synthetase
MVFDGSSTKQAEGGSSDCLLVPVAIYPDPTRINGYLVMTEVMHADGTPHQMVDLIDDDGDFWFV